MRVLFVGNSYTFYNDVPGQVTALADADPESSPILTERVAQGGATLALHARETGAWDRVAEPEWTHVVLQEKSTGPLHDAPDYHRFVRQLGERVRGEVLLYETWARVAGHEVYRRGWSGRDPRTMRRRVREELDRAAVALRARVVPVGTAWERALAAHPELVLHDTDGHHASPLGSHLAASTFYAFLTGRAPAWHPDDLDARAAAKLHRVAVAAVSG